MEAMLYSRLADGAVSCRLCAHHCRIKAGCRGQCGVRENRDGTLYTLVGERIVAAHADPIEKKPLHHFLPGSRSFSIAAAGCNFRCRFCQNYAISQLRDRNGLSSGSPVTPAWVVENARVADCRSISYTYTEPTVFFELAYATGVEARRQGLYNIFVTNGFLSEEACVASRDFLDAANVDLKSFSPRFYRDYCGGELQPVLDTINRLVHAAIHVEVTTLLIPGLNDAPEEVRQIARFLAALDPGLPWHISAFHPDYHLRETPSTPPATLLEAAGIGREEGLKHIYCGNIPGLGWEDTFCPCCGSCLIRRRGFLVLQNRLRTPSCPDCAAPLHITL